MLPFLHGRETILHKRVTAMRLSPSPVLISTQVRYAAVRRQTAAHAGEKELQVKLRQQIPLRCRPNRFLRVIFNACCAGFGWRTRKCSQATVLRNVAHLHITLQAFTSSASRERAARHGARRCWTTRTRRPICWAAWPRRMLSSSWARPACPCTASLRRTATAATSASCRSCTPRCPR